MKCLFQDGVYGFRKLMADPVFTVAAVLTLALGIGATATLFCWLSALILRPLPFPDASRIVLLFEVCKEKGWGRSSVSPGTFKDWQEQNQSFSALGAFAQTPMLIGLKEGAQNVPGLRMSPELWDVLKIHPCVGRGFLTEESQPGRDNVALLSHELWMRQFAGSEQVLGSALEINGSPHVIVGIMPKGVRFPFNTEIWTPLVISGKDLEQRDRHELLVAGRLRDQTPLKRALGEISGITQRIAERYPKTNHGWDCLMLPLRSLFVNGDEVQTFTALFLGGLFVLLTACANVANLLFARFGSRQKEMAIRMSLGASGQRIIRQILTESLLLSAMGTAVGILLALWFSGLMRRMVPAELAGTNPPVFDGYVLAFTFGLCLLATLVSGIIPAWRLARSDPGGILKPSSGNWVAPSMSRNWSTLWIVCEVACAVALLVGASLMMRTIDILNRVDLGFESKALLKADFELLGASWESLDNTKRVLYFEQLRDELLAVNGVKQVAIFRNGGWCDFQTDENPEPKKAYVYESSSNLFKCLQAPLIKGRYFSETLKDGLPEIVVNETFARQFWPGQDPIGKRFKPTGVARADLLPVVGVVRDFKLDRCETPRPVAFTSYRQAHLEVVSLFVRIQEHHPAVMGAVRLIIRRFDPNLGEPQVQTMAEALSDVFESRRLVLWLLGAFSGVSLVLAILGIYGVLSYLVSQRRREMGIRLAIGARPRDLIGLVVRQGMCPVLKGIGCGVIGSLVLRGLLKHQIVGIGGLDPISLLGSILLMMSVAFLACFLPAYQASKTDPNVVLRQE